MTNRMFLAAVAAFALASACGGTENDLELDDESSEVSDAVLSCRERCGDVDASGSLGVTDAVKVQRFAAGLDRPTTCQTLAADVNGDGRVTVTDAVVVQRAAAGLVAPLSLRCPAPIVPLGFGEITK